MTKFTLTDTNRLLFYGELITSLKSFIFHKNEIYIAGSGILNPYILKLLEHRHKFGYVTHIIVNSSDFCTVDYNDADTSKPPSIITFTAEFCKFIKTIKNSKHFIIKNYLNFKHNKYGGVSDTFFFSYGHGLLILPESFCNNRFEGSFEFIPVLEYKKLDNYDQIFNSLSKNSFNLVVKNKLVESIGCPVCLETRAIKNLHDYGTVCTTCYSKFIYS